MKAQVDKLSLKGTEIRSSHQIPQFQKLRKVQREYILLAEFDHK